MAREVQGLLVPTGLDCLVGGTGNVAQGGKVGGRVGSSNQA